MSPSGHWLPGRSDMKAVRSWTSSVVNLKVSSAVMLTAIILFRIRAELILILAPTSTPCDGMVRVRTFEATLAAVSVTPSGPINSKYGPWTYQVDLKANKGFQFGRANVDLYVWVTNLFDRENATYVYQSTGSPDATGWLTTPSGEKWVADNGAQATEWYNLAQRNPNNFSTPRQVRFGIRTDF